GRGAGPRRADPPDGLTASGDNSVQQQVRQPQRLLPIARRPLQPSSAAQETFSDRAATSYGSELWETESSQAAAPGQSSGVAGDAVQYRGDLGQVGGDVSVPGQSSPGCSHESRPPRRGPGPAPMPVAVRPPSAVMPPAQRGVRTRPTACLARPASIRTLISSSSCCQPCSGNWTLYGAGGSVVAGIPHPRARLALRVAARRAGLEGAWGGEAASWSMALMSASIVVLNGSVLRAARLRTAAPSSAEMVRSARAAARPGAMPSGSKRVISAARHRANTPSEPAQNSSPT